MAACPLSLDRPSRHGSRAFPALTNGRLTRRAPGHSTTRMYLYSICCSETWESLTLHSDSSKYENQSPPVVGRPAYRACPTDPGSRSSSGSRYHLDHTTMSVLSLAGCRLVVQKHSKPWVHGGHSA